MTCPHCLMRPVLNHGLCLPCLVEDVNPFAYADRPLPAQRTEALPGTAAKVRILEARAAEGMVLWHPNDAALVGIIDDAGAEELLALLMAERWAARVSMKMGQPRRRGRVRLLRAHAIAEGGDW